MPLYDFTCPSGHVSTLLVKSSARPDTSPCPQCHETARYTLGAPGPGIVTGSATPLRAPSATKEGFTTLYSSDRFVMRQKGTSLTHADYECPEGPHTWGDDYDGDPPDAPVCPAHGTPCKPVILGVADVDYFTKDHPHGKWDDSLGMFIRSRSHLQQVLKEKNLEPVTPGEYSRNIHAWAAKWHADAEREDEEVRKMLYGYQHGPDAALMHRHAEENPDMDWRPFAKVLGVE